MTIGNNPLVASTATTLQLAVDVADPGADTYAIRWQVYEDAATTPVYDVTNTALTLAYPRNLSVFRHRIVVTVTDDDTGSSTDAMMVETLDENNNILIQRSSPYCQPVLLAMPFSAWVEPTLSMSATGQFPCFWTAALARTY